MKKSSEVLIKSMLINTFLVTIKIIIGYVGKSRTLIADGIHSLSDLTTDVIAIVGNYISAKPADNDHPYGHGNLQYLTSIVVGIVIFLLGVGLIVEAFSLRVNIPSIVILYVSIITIIIKWIFSSYILRKGRKYNNNILIASGTESRTDAITPILVIISYFCSKLAVHYPIFRYSDSLFTIAIGIYILVVAIIILRDNIINIIGKREDNAEYLDKIKKIIGERQRVLGINDIILIKYGTYYVADIEIVLDKKTTLRSAQRLIDKIKKDLRNNKTKILYCKIVAKVGK